MSEIFGIILHKDIESFIEKKISPYLYDFGENRKCSILPFENDWKLENATEQR